MSDQLYVEYLFPGIIVGESSSQKIASLSEIDPPAAAQGYRTFTRSRTVVNDEELLGKPRDYSGWTYFGRKMSVADVQREEPDQKILIANMIGNGYPSIVRTDRGQSPPLGEKDTVASRPERQYVSETTKYIRGE